MLTAMLLFSFFTVQAIGCSSFNRSTGEAAQGLPLRNGVEYTAVLPVEAGRLTAAVLPLNCIGADGRLTVRLNEDGVEICRWQQETAAGSVEATMALPQPITMVAGRLYTITVSAAMPAGSSLTGIQTADGALFCTLRFLNATLRNAVLATGAILTAALVLCLWLRVPQTAVMTGVLAVLAAAYVLAFPPGTSPDETNHFLRAYEVASGGLTSRHMEPDGAGGNMLPAALTRYDEPDAVIDGADTVPMVYGNTALYSPVSYLPQALGIRAALLFTHKAQTVFYAGRAANALICVILCALALRLLPFGQVVLFLVLAFPTTGQEMGSLSPDGFTIGIAALFMAVVLRLAYTDMPMRRGYWAMGVLGAVLSQCKIIYVVLLLLVLLIPNARFGSRRQAILRKWGMLALLAALNVAWLLVSTGYLVEFNPGVDSDDQVRYVLTHLPAYLMVCLRTVFTEGVIWIESSIAQNMGQLEISIHRLVSVGFYTLLLYALSNTSCGKSRLTARAGVLLLSTFVLGCGLILTSLYVQWTPLQSKLIRGVQGRYFTPLYMTLFAFILLLRAPRNDIAPVRPRVIGGYACLGALLLNGIALMDIVHYFA